MAAEVQIARRAGQAVVLDACGQPHTVADLTATIRVLEGRAATAPSEERRIWRAALVWRRAVLAALEQAEADDAQSRE